MIVTTDFGTLVSTTGENTCGFCGNKMDHDHHSPLQKAEYERAKKAGLNPPVCLVRSDATMMRSRTGMCG